MQISNPGPPRVDWKYSFQVHHEWTAPFAIAALYSHPLEHLFTGQVWSFWWVAFVRDCCNAKVRLIRQFLLVFYPDVVTTQPESTCSIVLSSSQWALVSSWWALPFQLPGSGSAWFNFRSFWQPLVGFFLKSENVATFIFGQQTFLSLQVMNDHCGYHFPLHFSPEFHDFHHLKFVSETPHQSNSQIIKDNYWYKMYKLIQLISSIISTIWLRKSKISGKGIFLKILIWQHRFHTSYGWFGIWDWIHGTDDKFDKSTLHR